MQKSSILLLLLSVLPALLAAACRNVADVAEQSPSVAQVTELELNVREDDPLYLSPDGRRIAWLGLSELCVYEVNEETTNCFPVPSISDERSLHWSPDSSQLAFTEAYFTSGHDADIWILSLPAGTLTNLTDDGVTQNPLNRTNAMSDVLPRWFADGRNLAFVSYETGPDARNVHLYTITSNGSSPYWVMGLTSSFGYRVQAIDTWGDNLIAFSQLCDIFSCNDEDQGIWVVESDDPDSLRRVLWLPPAEASSAFQLQFSATGEYLSACRFPATLVGGCEQILIEVDGRDKFIETPAGTEAIFWSPAGNAFLALVNDPEAPGLYYFSRPGAEGQLLHPGSYHSPTKGPIPGALWASNNTALLLEGEGESVRYLLLSLGSGAE